MLYAAISHGARYTFSGKERDEETGYSITSLRSVSSLRLGKSKQACFCSRPLRRFGAKYYNSAYSIWLSVDPMSEKYPSLSPYAYCGNNPVKLVDPNGAEIGNYYDISGHLMGSDGNEDGKIYLVSNQESVSTDEKGQIIVNNYGDVHQLPDIASRGQILDILQNNDSEDPNSESGGCYGSGWNIEKQQYESPCVMWGETKHYDSPCKTSEMGYTQVNVPCFIVLFDFHSHGSGECSIGSDIISWTQTPSPKDRANAGVRSGGRTFAAFGMSSQKVYFYNENGTYATWSFDQFRNNN